MGKLVAALLEQILGGHPLYPDSLPHIGTLVGNSCNQRLVYGSSGRILEAILQLTVYLGHYRGHNRFLL